MRQPVEKINRLLGLTFKPELFHRGVVLAVQAADHRCQPVLQVGTHGLDTRLFTTRQIGGLGRVGRKVVQLPGDGLLFADPVQFPITVNPGGVSGVRAFGVGRLRQIRGLQARLVWRQVLARLLRFEEFPPSTRRMAYESRESDSPRNPSVDRGLLSGRQSVCGGWFRLQPAAQQVFGRRCRAEWDRYRTCYSGHWSCAATEIVAGHSRIAGTSNPPS